MYICVVFPLGPEVGNRENFPVSRKQEKSGNCSLTHKSASKYNWEVLSVPQLVQEAVVLLPGNIVWKTRNHPSGESVHVFLMSTTVAERVCLIVEQITEVSPVCLWPFAWDHLETTSELKRVGISVWTQSLWMQGSLVGTGCSAIHAKWREAQFLEFDQKQDHHNNVAIIRCYVFFQGWGQVMFLSKKRPNFPVVKTRSCNLLDSCLSFARSNGVHDWRMGIVWPAFQSPDLEAATNQASFPLKAPTENRFSGYRQKYHSPNWLFFIQRKKFQTRTPSGQHFFPPGWCHCKRGHFIPCPFRPTERPRVSANPVHLSSGHLCVLEPETCQC